MDPYTKCSAAITRNVLPVPLEEDTYNDQSHV